MSAQSNPIRRKLADLTQQERKFLLAVRAMPARHRTALRIFLNQVREEGGSLPDEATMRREIDALADALQRVH